MSTRNKPDREPTQRTSPRPGATVPYRIVSCEDGLGIVEIGPICLIEWRAPVIGRRFERQREALEAIVAKYPSHAGVVCVMAASSPVPEDRYRRSLVDMYSRLAPQLRAIVCVLEGSGFVAAAARSGVSGIIQLISGRPGDIIIRATVEAAVPWLADHFSPEAAESVQRAHLELTSSLSERT